MAQENFIPPMIQMRLNNAQVYRVPEFRQRKESWYSGVMFVTGGNNFEYKYRIKVSPNGIGLDDRKNVSILLDFPDQNWPQGGLKIKVSIEVYCAGDDGNIKGSVTVKALSPTDHTFDADIGRFFTYYHRSLSFIEATNCLDENVFYFAVTSAEVL